MSRTITVSITDEEEKALLTDMTSIQDWLDNAIHNKARQCIDGLCQLALDDQTNAILTAEEKQELVSALAAQGKFITTVKQLPPDIKAQIVSNARVKSAAERQAEREKEGT
jgi:hypothetical protein